MQNLSFPRKKILDFEFYWQKVTTDFVFMPEMLLKTNSFTDFSDQLLHSYPKSAIQETSGNSEKKPKKSNVMWCLFLVKM